MVRKSVGLPGRAHLSVIFAQYCDIALKALIRFHALGSNACLHEKSVHEKSVCQRRYHEMSITKAPPKLNSTQGVKSVRLTITD